MRQVIFCGPTLPFKEVQARLPNADIRGPAARGDVLGAVLDGAANIGLIDGYFETRPSVWHKEILWALSRGVRVFGAASMGAMRASELHRFGMTGVGDIFEAFLEGHLTDDDEVAVTHGPAALGFPLLSVAMVDLRATLRVWLDAGSLDLNTCTRMLTAQKKLHFAQRSFEKLAASFPAHEKLVLNGSALPSAKASDACRMLELMQRDGHQPGDANAIVFEETFHWLKLQQMVAQRGCREESIDGSAVDNLKLLQPS